MADEKKEKELEEVKSVIPDDDDPTGKPPEGYTEQEWMDLSKAEREGILDKDDEEGGEEKPAVSEEELKKIAEGEEAPEQKTAREKTEASVEAKKKADAEAEVKRKSDEEAAKVAGKTPKQIEADRVAAEDSVRKAEEEKAAQAAAGVLTDEELLKFRPVVLDSELPAVDKVTADISKKFDELDEKLDSGELAQKDYNRQRDALNRQVTMANIQAREEIRTQKVWEKEQATFLRSRPEYVDKSTKGNVLFGALTAVIKGLGADPKYDSVSGIQLLIEADAIVKETMGIGKRKEVANPEDGKGKGGKPPAPAPTVKTLTGIPSAEANLAESGWSALDKLSGEAYEAALEKMSPELRAKYLDAR